MRETKELEDQCDSFRKEIKELDEKILSGGMQQNIESESYIAMTKKHEQKQQHLMDIINRQQKRINKQQVKIQQLEEEEVRISSTKLVLKKTLNIQPTNQSSPRVFFFCHILCRFVHDPTSCLVGSG